jgi:chloramphenicol O-acetyltransferase type B
MLSAAMPLLTSQNVDELYRFWKSYGNRTANVTA